MTANLDWPSFSSPFLSPVFLLFVSLSSKGCERMNKESDRENILRNFKERTDFKITQILLAFGTFFGKRTKRVKSRKKEATVQVKFC